MLFSTTPASAMDADSRLLEPSPPPLPVAISFKQFLTSPKNPHNVELLELLQNADLTPEKALAFTFAPTPYRKPTEEETRLCEEALLQLKQEVDSNALISTECIARLKDTPIYSTMEKLWYSLAAAERSAWFLQDRTSRITAMLIASTCKGIPSPIPLELLGAGAADVDSRNTPVFWKEFTNQTLGRIIFPQIRYLKEEITAEANTGAHREALFTLKFLLGWQVNAITTLSHALKTSETLLQTADLINILAATAPDKEFIDSYSVYELATAIMIATFYAALDKSRAVDKASWIHMAEITRWDYTRISKALNLFPTEFAMVSIPGRDYVTFLVSQPSPQYAILLFLTAYHAKAEATKSLVASIIPVDTTTAVKLSYAFLTPKHPPRINRAEYIAQDVEAYSLDTPPMENFPATLYTMKLKHLSSPRLPFLMQCTEVGALRLIFPTAKATINNLLHAYGAPPNKTVAQLPLIIEAFLALADDTAGELLTTTLDNRFLWVEPRLDLALRDRFTFPLIVLNSEVESIYKLMGTTIEDEQKMYHPLNLFRVVDMGACPGTVMPTFQS
jgi:hypothetical protein